MYMFLERACSLENPPVRACISTDSQITETTSPFCTTQCCRFLQRSVIVFRIVIHCCRSIRNNNVVSTAGINEATSSIARQARQEWMSTHVFSQIDWEGFPTIPTYTFPQDNFLKKRSLFPGDSSVHVHLVILSDQSQVSGWWCFLCNISWVLVDTYI